MSILTKLNHLRKINSVDWRSMLRVLGNLYPDYHFGNGTTNSVVNVTLELTYRCNWRCNFCFLQENVLNKRVEELSYEEILAIIDEVAPHHMGFYITGGEPFVRKDCIDIIRAIKQRGLKVGVNTNSHILNEEKIDELIDIGMDYLITSIHGPKEVHDAVTDVKSYDKVIENLKYWKSKPSKTKILINYVITPDTSAHMNHMIEIAAEANVDAITFQHETFLTKKDRMKHDPLWTHIFGDEEVELSYLDFDTDYYDLPNLAERMQSAKDKASELGVMAFFKPDLVDEQLENWYTDDFHLEAKCSYVYTDARINPQGDVIACQFIPQVMGNVRDDKLMTILNNEKFIQFRHGIQEAGGLFPACSRCCKLYRSF